LRSAPRLHRRRESRGDAADDDEWFSAQGGSTAEPFVDETTSEA
jgi:hypothetical protein